MSFTRTLDRMSFYVGAASAVLAVVGFLVGGVWTGFGALVGGAFGIINWLLLRWVGGQIVKANDRGKAVWGIILTVKLTAGLGVVWGILSTGWVDPTGFAIGVGGWCSVPWPVLSMPPRPVSSTSSTPTTRGVEMGHETWFSMFLTPLYELAQQFMSYMDYPVRDDDMTWTGLLGGPYDLTSHEDGGPRPAGAAPRRAHLRHPHRARDVHLQPAARPAEGPHPERVADGPQRGRDLRRHHLLDDERHHGAQGGALLPAWIGTCAFFILGSNFFGLVPGFLPPTSSLNVTLACSVVIFVLTHWFGIKEHGVVNYLKHFLGPIQAWYALPLMILMLLVETVSHLVRPASLSIRLMANMFADHTVIGMFMDFPGPFVYPVPILLLGTLVVVVQTLVFCILSTVYISMAIEHQDH